MSGRPMKQAEKWARDWVHGRSVRMDDPGSHPLVGEICERVAAEHTVDCDERTAAYLAGLNRGADEGRDIGKDEFMRDSVRIYPTQTTVTVEQYITGNYEVEDEL